MSTEPSSSTGRGRDEIVRSGALDGSMSEIGAAVDTLKRLQRETFQELMSLRQQFSQLERWRGKRPEDFTSRTTIRGSMEFGASFVPILHKESSRAMSLDPIFFQAVRNSDDGKFSGQAAKAAVTNCLKFLGLGTGCIAKIVLDSNLNMDRPAEIYTRNGKTYRKPSRTTQGSLFTYLRARTGILSQLDLEKIILRVDDKGWRAVFSPGGACCQDIFPSLNLIDSREALSRISLEPCSFHVKERGAMAGVSLETVSLSAGAALFVPTKHSLKRTSSSSMSAPSAAAQLTYRPLARFAMAFVTFFSQRVNASGDSELEPLHLNSPFDRQSRLDSRWGADAFALYSAAAVGKFFTAGAYWNTARQWTLMASPLTEQSGNWGLAIGKRKEQCDKDSATTSALQADAFYRISLSTDNRFTMIPGISILLPDRDDMPRVIAYTVKAQCSL